MFQISDVPQDFKCYLCDLLYWKSQDVFLLYNCSFCMKFTPYCISCDSCLAKLFGSGNVFKCLHCNKLTNSINKIEIGSSNPGVIINSLTHQRSYKNPFESILANNVRNSIKMKNSSFFFDIDVNSTKNEKDKGANFPPSRNFNILENNKIVCSDSFNRSNNIVSGYNRNINSLKRTLMNSPNNNVVIKNNFASGNASDKRVNKFFLDDIVFGKKKQKSLKRSSFDAYVTSKNKKIKGHNNLISVKMSKIYRNKNN